MSTENKLKIDDFTKALAECINQAQCAVVDPMAHAEIWKEELLELAQGKEPVSEDLEHAVNAYIGYAPEVDESSSTYGKRQAFKAGANWQKQQMMAKAVEVDKAFAKWEDEDLNAEELKYYTEVNARVMQKLIDAAGEIA
jgi:hypothetical protein